MDKKQTAIIYKTKHLTTKKYAGWLSIKLDADLYELSDIRKRDLEKYKNIIYGGYIENGRIKGIGFIKRNYEKIKDKNIIIFSVGLGLYDDKEIFDMNFSSKYKFKNIRFFQLLGDFNYKKLSIVDKFKIKYLNDKINFNLINLSESISNSNKSNLNEILKYIEQKI